MENHSFLHPPKNIAMKRVYLLMLSALLLLGSCNQAHKGENAAVAEVALEDNMSAADYADAAATGKIAAEMSSPEQVSTVDPVKPVAEKKIIRSGTLSIEAKDVKESKAGLDNTLKKFQGYYENESATNADTYTSYDLVVRIPSANLDKFLSELERGKDKITEKSLKAEDVSTQYYDVESRLKSKRAYLERYQQMVSSAKSVKDLLEIQEQIRMLQEEIDASESVLRSMSGQVNYSTLTIRLFEEKANLPMGSNSFMTRVKEAFAFGWNLIENLALGVIGLWPVVLLVAAVVYVLRTIRKRKRAKRTGTGIE